jgi:hypothetical protein
MGKLEDDILKSIEASKGQVDSVASNASRFAARQQVARPMSSGEPVAEFVEIETVNSQGEVTGKQVVEKHSGFHYSEESQRLLGVHKKPPQLTPGVIYDSKGEAVGLAGKSSDGSRLVSS